MDKFTEKILTPNNVICQNIEKREILEDDGLLAQNGCRKSNSNQI